MSIYGHRYGMLTAIRRVESPDGDARALVRCDCGVEKTVRVKHLAKAKSCGCTRGASVAAWRATTAPAPKRVGPIPPPWRRSDTAVIGALLIALDLPGDELSWLPPMDAAELAGRAGLDVDDDLNRPVLRRWLEATACGAVYGVRVAYSDVRGFLDGAEQPAELRCAA
jgi:hypothetical protein